MNDLANYMASLGDVDAFEGVVVSTASRRKEVEIVRTDRFIATGRATFEALRAVRVVVSQPEGTVSVC